MAELVQLAGIGIGGALFGPVGAAVGGALGQLVGQELFGKTIDGPRIDSFRATGGAVGTPMVRGYGNNRLGGELMWFGHVRTVTRTKKVGGIAGFGGQKVKTFEYYGDFAIGLQEGPGVCLRKIKIQGETWWQQPGEAAGNPNYLDQQRRLLEFGPDALTAQELAQYNASARSVAASQGRSEFFTFYPGSETQDADPTIQSYLGAAAPAYRGTAYVVFKNLPLTQYGGALPLIEFETVSGPTQAMQTVLFWKSKELFPWVEGSADPRSIDNTHEYRYSVFGYNTWHPTEAAAIADAEDDLGQALIPTLLGWHKGVTGIEVVSVSPYSVVTAGEEEVLSLHFNRYTDLIDPDDFYATLINDPTNAEAEPCESFRLNAIVPGGPRFYWTGRWDVDGENLAGGPDGLPGVWQFSIRGPDAGDFDLPVLGGSDYSNNCIDYPPNGIYSPTVNAYRDTFIEVRRVPQCPPPICDDKDPLPENADYCVDSEGNIYPEVTFSETSDGTFLQLALYATAGGEVTQYPLGPVLNLDYAPHVALNTEEWWEPFYLAAVAAGTAEAGWTFDATGTGGAGTYPRQVTTVCAAMLSQDPFCQAEAVAVADVIEAECVRCVPLVLADIDTSLITDSIWGIKYLQNPTGREAIEQLRTFSFLDVVDGPQLKFVPRGLPTVATLELDDLAAHEYGSQRPPALEVTRVDDIQLPREVRVNYIDQNADFQPGQQYDRRLVTDAVNELTIELGIVMGADDGKRIATVSLYDQWAARKALEFKLGPRWLMLEPTDCIELPDLDGYTRARIDRDDLALPGLRTMQAVRDEISLYGRSFVDTGATPQIPDTGTDAPVVQGPTTAVILDLPTMGVGDADAGYWVAFYGVLETWESAEGFRSLDAGTTYDGVVDAASAIAGTVIMPYDGTEMTVRVYGGTLMNATAAAAAAGTNRFAIGVAGRWVIGTFETVTDNGGGEYTLSDLTVGLFDTQWAVGEDGSPSTFLGVAGDAFVMLETASRVSEEDSIVGDTVLFRPVTGGTIFENGVDQSFIARGNGRGFVTGFGTTTPPEHSAGATYVAGAGAAGEWLGYDDFIVHDVDDQWYFEFPEDGRQVRTSNGAGYQFTAGSPGFWVPSLDTVESSNAIADLETRTEQVEQALQLDAATLLGRSSGSAGAAEEITLGTGLSMSGATLNATGGATSPAQRFYEYFDLLEVDGDVFDSGGTSTPVYGGSAGHPGVLTLSTGSSTSATSGIKRGGLTGATSELLFKGSGEIVFRSLVEIVTLSAASNTGFFYVGLLDRSTGGVPPNGIYAIARSDTGLWQLAATVAGVITSQNGPAWSTGWHLVEIVVNAAGTEAELLIDGVSAATLTSGLPTAGFSYGAQLQKTAGSTAFTCRVDLFEVEQTFSPPRY